MDEPYILSLSCDDRLGLVATVSTLLFRNGCNIQEAHQFDDSVTGRFFMRIAFVTATPRDQLERVIGTLAATEGMEWRLSAPSDRANVLLLVSKFDHCLHDLLYRAKIDELRMNVVGIVCNHPRKDLRTSDFGGIPFHYLPVTPATKPDQEARIKALVDDLSVDLVILARYMQVLSADLVTFLSGRCINIHHSFLPSFKGSKPYHQAHARGVKIIGATAHYVTHDLDEGPIIVQDVKSVTHADKATDLVRKGRDVEKRVLAEAVRLHLEARVFVHQGRTVVFEG